MVKPPPEACGEEYGKALELAATARYREARVKLQGILDTYPDYVGALILLGKVEYYLRRPASSRRCFETALTYEPGNAAAWFGLQFYRERRRSMLLGIVAACLLIAIGLTGAGVYLRLTAEIGTLKNELAGRLAELAGAEEHNAVLMEGISNRIDERFDAVSIYMQETVDAFASYRSDSKDNIAALETHFREVAAAQELNAGSLERLSDAVGRLTARMVAEEKSPKQPQARSPAYNMSELK